MKLILELFPYWTVDVVFDLTYMLIKSLILDSRPNLISDSTPDLMDGSTCSSVLDFV